MAHLDPTYLRYIYDGLIKGSIHPENESELPEGLIGLYEESFEENTPVMHRRKLLQRFALFALLKKEVSISFVAEVLEESENDILEFINTYSSWFNSPEIGKYQLYHERLKVYVLQKLSEKEIHTIQEKVIARLEQAIEEQKTDEFERYALEFLNKHLFDISMIAGDGIKLIALSYSQTHWQRQLKISKGYSWSKSGLKDVMSWASKYKEDEVVECGLQMVTLHHQEQNAAPQIVALFAEGDFDSALKRISEFGGSNKECLERKFILYMLSLIELIMLDSKIKPFSKDGIERLLKHFDDNVPAKQFDLISWGHFFPNKLMFHLLCELKKIHLDLNIILLRSNFIDFKFLEKVSNLSLIEKEVIIISSSIFENESLAVINQLSNLSTIMSKSNYKEEADFLLLKAIALSNKMKEGYYRTFRNSALKSIVLTLKIQNKELEAIKLIDQIDLDYERVDILLSISRDTQNYISLISKSVNGLGDQIEKKLNILQTVLKDSIRKKHHIITKNTINQYVDLISELDIFAKSEYQYFLVQCYCELNDIEKAIEIADQIEFTDEKEYSFSSIAFWFQIHGMNEGFNKYFKLIQSAIIKAHFYSEIISSSTFSKSEIEIAFQEMIFEIKKIPEFSTDDWGCAEYPRNELIETIANRLTGHGFIDLAINLALLLTDVGNSIQQYYYIIFSDIDFLADGKLSEYFYSYFLKSNIELNIRQSDEFLLQIIKIFWIKEKYIQALKLIPYIKDNDKKLGAIISNLLSQTIEELNLTLIPDLLKFISSDLSKGIILDEVISKSDYIFDSSQIIQIFSNFPEEDKDRRLSYFINRQLDLERQNLAMELLPLIIDPYWKCNVLEHLVYRSAKIKNIELGTKFLEEIKNLQKKFKLNINQYSIEMQFNDYLSAEYYKVHDKSWQIFNKKSIEISKKIKDKRIKICNIYLQLLRTKQYDLLVRKIDLIDDEYDRSVIIQKISSELFSIQHINIIDNITSLYPENQKKSHPAYKFFLSNFIIFCESNNVNIDLEIHYKYFISSWMDALELAKQLFLNNIKEKAAKLLHSIDHWGKAWALIDFAEFLRINGYEKDSKQFLDDGKLISIEKNDLMGIKSAIKELIITGNYLLAEKISLVIKNTNDKHDCWIEMGRTIFKYQNMLNIEIIKFKDFELKKFVNRGWVGELTINNSSKLITLRYVLQSIEDISIVEIILHMYFLNELFSNEIKEEQISRYKKALNIQWALNIKNQIN